MAGYVASARLQGGVPRFVGGTGETAWSVAIGSRTSVLGAPADDLPMGVDQVELVGRPLDEVLGDWLASVGESWSQLTFFLFDPESWR